MIRKTLTFVALFAGIVLAQSGPPLPSQQAPQMPVWVAPASAVNGGGTVLSPQLLLPDGTAGAPALAFANATNMGLYKTGSSSFGVSLGGSQYYAFGQSAFSLLSDSLAINLGASSDVSLSRGAADRLDLATGDSFKIVSGGLGVGATQTGAGNIEASAAVISPVFNVSSRIANSSGGTFISMTAPTITSAGSSPSVSTANGTVAGRINVGTGGTASTIVLAMPTAPTGWNCYSNNITAAAANRANLHMVQQSSTTTAATLQWQTVSTGAATAFTASDIVSYICFAY